MIITRKGNGLQALPRDRRDFVLGAAFGNIDITTLPEEYELPTRKIKDQEDTDMCTAYGTTLMSEFQELVGLDPLFQFAKIKEVRGEYKAWGASARDAAKAGLKGFLEELDAPYTLKSRTRNEIANWDAWDSKYDEMAIEHRKKAYFFIKEFGYEDIFDAIRAAMWQFRAKKRAIGVGLVWRPTWDNSMRGIIPRKKAIGGGGHFVVVVGWKQISGNTYLKIQNSWGKDAGEDGYYYMNRIVANREITYGAFMFEDLPKGVSKEDMKHNNRDYLKKHWWERFKLAIKNYFKYIFI